MKVCPNCGEVCEDHMNFCKSCGNQLGGVAGGNAGAGQTYAEGSGFQGNGYNGNVPPNGQGNFYGAPEGPYSGMAIASLVLGIVGLFLGSFLFIPCILAIVFGIIGMNQAKRGYRGRGMAIAGLVLGIISIVITIIVLAFALSVVSLSVMNNLPWESLGGLY